MTEREFEPKCADFERRVRESFAKQQAMGTLGVSVAKIAPGLVELTLPNDPRWCQQHGFLHAGIGATVLDSACGYAAYSLMPEDAAVLTVEYKINLLSPARGDLFRAVARVRKPGRTITVSEGHLLAVSDGGETLVATMVGTIMAIRDRAGVEG